jgi:hypothetical protein
MDYTENLKMNRPEPADQFDLDHWNHNTDILDAYAKQETDERKASDDKLQKEIDASLKMENITGVLPVEQGGTGKTERQEALNELSSEVQLKDDIGENDEVVFIHRTKSDESLGVEASHDVQNVKMNVLAQKVFEIIKTRTFAKDSNGFVPMAGSAGSAGSAAFLSAQGTWDNPSFVESKIEAKSSQTVSVSDNTIIRITAGQSISVILKDCVKLGCTVTFINSTAITHTLSCNSVAANKLSTIQPNAFFKIAWNGSKWQNIVAPGVGKRITQYPQEDAPTDVYPCTSWQEISYDGAFFRASGGNAAAFIEKSGVLSKQESQNKAHSHEMDSAGGHKHGRGDMEISGAISGLGVNMGASGACYVSRAYSGSNPRMVSDSDARTISFLASRTWTGNTSENGSHSHTVHDDGGSESRPENYTIKIWKRTA